MNRIKRTERIAAMSQILSHSPNRVLSLSLFSEMFQAAKSTISEDIDMIKDAFSEYGLGDLETVAGAAGGVRYMPRPKGPEVAAFIEALCRALCSPERILPGGFLYITDILYDPQVMQRLGALLAAPFLDKRPDFVITVETKGIPAAMATAYYLGCPVVVARRDGKVTEGSLVSINYVTASSKRVQTMSLSKRAVKEGQRAVVIDDFLKGGGTAQGMISLLKEFNVDIAGTGFLIATETPKEKLVKEYKALMILSEVDEAEKSVRVCPAGAER